MSEKTNKIPPTLKRAARGTRDYYDSYVSGTPSNAGTNINDVGDGNPQSVTVSLTALKRPAK